MVKIVFFMEIKELASSDLQVLQLNKKLFESKRCDEDGALAKELAERETFCQSSCCRRNTCCFGKNASACRNMNDLECLTRNHICNNIQI